MSMRDKIVGKKDKLKKKIKRKGKQRKKIITKWLKI
jgi:hypothetical protein